MGQLPLLQSFFFFGSVASGNSSRAHTTGHVLSLGIVDQIIFFFFYPSQRRWDLREMPHTHRKVAHSSGKEAPTSRKR